MSGVSLLTPFVAWWNWAGWVTVVPGVQQGSTNFLLSALEIHYPDATVLSKGWFSWLLTSIGMLVAMAPNIYSPAFSRSTFDSRSLSSSRCSCFTGSGSQSKPPQVATTSTQVMVFSTSFIMGPMALKRNKLRTPIVGSSACSSVPGFFYGYDASAHLAEETLQASTVVAKGIYVATFSGWLLSVSTLPSCIRVTRDSGSQKTRVLVWVFRHSKHGVLSDFLVSITPDSPNTGLDC